MKASKMMVSALALLTMTVAGSAMAAATPITVSGGTINFTGEINDGACTVSPSSAQGQTIDLGNYKPADITKGQPKTPVKFDIVLENCSTDTYTTASFDFGGQADTDDASVLANNSGTGGATGVGVQLKDMDGKVIVLNTTSGAGAKMTLVPNTNTASFSAAMYGTKDTATVGHVSAATNFKVHYE